MDSNLIVGLLDVGRRRDSSVLRLEQFDGVTIVIAPKVIYEVYVVATRPRDRNGYGMSPERAAITVRSLLDRFTLVPDPVDLSLRWLDLCQKHGVSGKPAHDARLAAYALALGISEILTDNPGDFRRYGIDLL